MGRLPGSDSGRSISGGPPRTAGSPWVRAGAGRKVVRPECSGGECERRLAGQAAVAMKSRARSLRSQGVQALAHSPTPEVRAEARSAATARGSLPYPRRRGSTFAGGANAPREVWLASSTSAARPAASADGSTPPFSAVSHSDPGIHAYTLPLHNSRHTMSLFGLSRACGGSVRATRRPPSKALSTFLGHACVTIPLDRYGHLSPGSEKEAQGQLESCLERSVGGGPAGGCATRGLNERLSGGGGIRTLGGP
jgi:hypothetical protein